MLIGSIKCSSILAPLSSIRRLSIRNMDQATMLSSLPILTV